MQFVFYSFKIVIKSLVVLNKILLVQNYNSFYNKSITHFKLKEFKKACIDLKKSIKLGKEVFKDEFSEICF